MNTNEQDVTTGKQPSDEILCRCVRIARMLGKCVYIVAEDDQWFPTEDDVFPRESVSGNYYEVFPTGRRIQRRQIGTQAVLDETWWSDLTMREDWQERAEAVLEMAQKRLQ